MSEQLVEITSKLYSARRSLKSLCPDIFDTRCKELQEVIEDVAEKKNVSDIEAMIALVKQLEGKEIAQMWVMAAYVEMVEPS